MGLGYAEYRLALPIQLKRSHDELEDADRKQRIRRLQPAQATPGRKEDGRRRLEKTGDDGGTHPLSLTTASVDEENDEYGQEPRY